MSTSEELIAAIRDRITAGKNKSEIKAEAIAAGHSEEIFEAAFVLANQNPEPVEVLPSSISLWREGWVFVLNKWKLVAAVAVPLALFGVGDVLAESALEGYAYMYVSILLGILSAVIYLLGFMVALRLLSGKASTVAEACLWARKHFWSFVFVYVLVSLIVLGGYLLFLVPGIIAAFTLYFAVYVAAIEGVKGEQALIRSRQLVKGKWWLLVKKLVGVNIYNLLVILALLIIGAVVMAIMPIEIPNQINILLTVVFSQLLGVSVAFMLVSVGSSLYNYFSTHSTETVKKVNPLTYRLLGGLGLLAFISLMAVAFFASANPDFIEREFSVTTVSPDNEFDRIAALQLITEK